MKNTMNLLFVLAISLVSFGAAAGQISDRSWEQLLSDKWLAFSFPMVKFDNASVSLANTCKDGEKLRSLLAVKACTKSSAHRFDCATLGAEGGEVCRELAAGEKAIGVVRERV